MHCGCKNPRSNPDAGRCFAAFLIHFFQVVIDAVDGGGLTGQTVVLVTATGGGRTPTSFGGATANDGRPTGAAPPISSVELPEFPAEVNEDTLPNTVVVPLGVRAAKK